MVCSKTFEEHMERLSIVFERLRKANLTLKPQKCSFARTQVVYLGHVISIDGVSPDPEKTSKVREFPVPKDVTSLRQFLGPYIILQALCTRICKHCSSFIPVVEEGCCF